MLKTGLTGGLASGKSFVGHALAELGCHLLQADELGHQALRSGGEAYAAAVEEFGRQILGEDGEIDRRRLASLNRLVHPVVFEREEQWLGEVARSDPHGIAVIEAAILIETGSYKRFDRIILVIVDPAQQIERAIHRDGVTRDEALARLSRQMPLEEKKKFADYIIDTSGTKTDTLRQTREVFESLRSIAT
jgi:dephospho-CoA kinase